MSENDVRESLFERFCQENPDRKMADPPAPCVVLVRDPSSPEDNGLCVSQVEGGFALCCYHRGVDGQGQPLPDKWHQINQDLHPTLEDACAALMVQMREDRYFWEDLGDGTFMVPAYDVQIVETDD